MRKHLVFISNEIAKEKGGIQNMCYLLSEYFMGFYDETIICSSDSNIAEVKNSSVIRSKYSSAEFSDFCKDSIFILLKLHKTKKIDFIITAQYSLCTGCLVMKKKYGIPFGVMVHGNEVYGDAGQSKIKSMFLNYYRKIILNKASVIFANSSFTRRLVSDISDNKNIIVSTPPIQYIEDLKIVECKQNFKMFSIARHVERKGIQLVIESMPALIVKYPNLHYDIAGSGEYTQALMNIVSNLSLEKYVTFLGALSETEKNRYLQECSLFLMPSYSIPSQHSVEGFGIVYLEANNYGKFVIGSKSGGIPDAIWDGHSGFLSEENNTESVTKCIDVFFSSKFNYDPNECREWARRHSVENSGLIYTSEINRILKKE